MKNLGPQICQICSDNVGKTVDGDRFVACDFCSFPVCRPCYEYERKDGNQSCPQCKTTYKRHKGNNTTVDISIFMTCDPFDFDQYVLKLWIRLVFDMIC